MKRKIERSRAPLTILWGRDGWEKFTALIIFGVSLGFQFVGLFCQVKKAELERGVSASHLFVRAGMVEALLLDRLSGRSVSQMSFVSPVGRVRRKGQPRLSRL